MSRILKKLNIEDEVSSSVKPGPDLKLVPPEELSSSLSVKQRVPVDKKRWLMIFILSGLVLTSIFLVKNYFASKALNAPLTTGEAAKPKLGLEEQLNQEAMTFYKNKDYVRALDRFESLLKTHPKDAVLMNNMGLAFLKLGQLQKAEVSFQEVLKIEPKDSVVYNNLGSLKMLETNWEEAISYFYQAILYHPEMIEPHLNLAKAFEMAGRPMEAIPEYQYYLKYLPVGGDPSIAKLIEKRIVSLNSFSRYTEKKVD